MEPAYIYKSHTLFCMVSFVLSMRICTTEHPGAKFHRPVIILSSEIVPYRGPGLSILPPVALLAKLGAALFELLAELLAAYLFGLSLDDLLALARVDPNNSLRRGRSRYERCGCGHRRDHDRCPRRRVLPADLCKSPGKCGDLR